MDSAITNWLEKNKVVSINLKKGGESVYKTDGTSSGDIADQLASIYDGLPTGSYRLLGREKTGTNWENAQTYFFEKKGTTTMQTGSGMISQEQFQLQLELERKKWEFDLLVKNYEKLEARIEKLEERFGKMSEAVRDLVDDDDSNDSSAIDKIAKMATTAKSMFSDIKIN